jgi:hypothetical protein
VFLHCFYVIFVIFSSFYATGIDGACTQNQRRKGCSERTIMQGLLEQAFGVGIFLVGVGRGLVERMLNWFGTAASGFKATWEQQVEVFTTGGPALLAIGIALGFLFLAVLVFLVAAFAFVALSPVILIIVGARYAFSAYARQGVKGGRKIASKLPKRRRMVAGVKS